MAERLLKPEEYFPELEALGFSFVEVVEIDGIPHSAFVGANGRRLLYPGARGYPDEIPMIPQRKLEDLLTRARALAEAAAD